MRSLERCVRDHVRANFELVIEAATFDLLDDARRTRARPLAAAEGEAMWGGAQCAMAMRLLTGCCTRLESTGAALLETARHVRHRPRREGGRARRPASYRVSGLVVVYRQRHSASATLPSDSSSSSSLPTFMGVRASRVVCAMGLS